MEKTRKCVWCLFPLCQHMGEKKSVFSSAMHVHKKRFPAKIAHPLPFVSASPCAKQNDLFTFHRVVDRKCIFIFFKCRSPFKYSIKLPLLSILQAKKASPMLHSGYSTKPVDGSFSRQQFLQPVLPSSQKGWYCDEVFLHPASAFPIPSSPCCTGKGPSASISSSLLIDHNQK